MEAAGDKKVRASNSIQPHAHMCTYLQTHTIVGISIATSRKPVHIIWAYSPDQGLPLGLARQSPLHLLPSTTERESGGHGGGRGEGECEKGNLGERQR